MSEIKEFFMLALTGSFQELIDWMIKLEDQKPINLKKEYMTINLHLTKILCVYSKIKRKSPFIKFISL